MCMVIVKDGTGMNVFDNIFDSDSLTYNYINEMLTELQY